MEPVENADGSYTLRRVAQAEAVEAPQTGQEDLQTPSQEQPTVLPEMTVTATLLGRTGYSVTNSSTATKTDIPLIETPVSVQSRAKGSEGRPENDKNQRCAGKRQRRAA